MPFSFNIGVADAMFCIIVMLMIYLVEEREAPGGRIYHRRGSMGMKI